VTVTFAPAGPLGWTWPTPTPPPAPNTSKVTEVTPVGTVHVVAPTVLHVSVAAAAGEAR
jgi:hypothetical protein